MRRVFCAVYVMLVCEGWTSAQVLTPRSSQPTSNSPQNVTSTVTLAVPADTPIKVGLDRELRLQKPGQVVHGKVTEPVYAFDKLVVPLGSEVFGKVAAIEDIPTKRRTLEAMDGDFSPPHHVHIQFDELVLADGRHLPLNASASPGSNGVLQLVSANIKYRRGKNEADQNIASRKAHDLRQEIKRQWESARQQIHEPGKAHRLKRFAVAQLPYHPQYIDLGTSFNVDLRTPLDFGNEQLKSEALSAVGTPIPAGSLLHALLITPLSSAASKKGDPVEAVISQPLFAENHLFLPQGSHLEGVVLDARPARRLHRSGQLRIVFHKIVPPSGIEQRVEASLEGVEVAEGEHLKLDSEGGAQAVTPKTRYLTTAISVALASASGTDSDRGLHRGTGPGDIGGGAANGASGFRFLGMIAGALAHSRVVSSGFGIYGATMSFYSHFLTRGNDVVYPKDMSMVIGLAMRRIPPAASENDGAHPQPDSPQFKQFAE